MFWPPGRLQVELEQLTEKGIVGPYRDALEDLLAAQEQIEEGLQTHLVYSAICAQDFRRVAAEINALQMQNDSLRESNERLKRRDAQVRASIMDLLR